MTLSEALAAANVAVIEYNGSRTIVARRHGPHGDGFTIWTSDLAHEAAIAALPAELQAKVTVAPDRRWAVSDMPQLESYLSEKAPDGTPAFAPQDSADWQTAEDVVGDALG